MRTDAVRAVRRAVSRAAAGALVIAAGTVGVPAAAPSFVPVACATGPGPYTGSTPWPQKLLQADTVRTLSEGEGQLVAVLASGIDVNNAQFAPGQITVGHDVLGGADAHTDCDGRGTFAAGLIGAQPQSSTTFAGLAPGVRLDPIRVAQTFDNQDNAAADPDVLATGINEAVDDRATVILVAVPAATSTPALQAAVTRALARDIVVVSPAAAGQPAARSYPTAYPDVLGVGAVDINGAPVQGEAGIQVGLSAPGKSLVSTAPGSGVVDTGLSDVPTMSAAFVAAAAALVRSAAPGLHAPQVITRLELTADRPTPTQRTDQTGWGTVDPYAALTNDLPPTAALPTAPGVAAASHVAAVPAAAPAREHGRGAALIAVGVLLLSVLIAAGAAAVRRSRELEGAERRATTERRKHDPSMRTPAR